MVGGSATPTKIRDHRAKWKPPRPWHRHISVQLSGSKARWINRQPTEWRDKGQTIPGSLSICQNVQGGYMWLQMLQIILMSTPNKPRGCGKWECHFRKSSDLVVGTPWSLNRGSLIQDWYSFIPSKNWASLRLNHTEPRHPHHMSHPPSGPRYQRLQTPESDRVGYAELHSAAIDLLPAQRQTASRQEIGMKWWSSNYHSK